MKEKKIYALDTNIVSYFLKGIHAIDEKISSVLSQDNEIVITPICLYEVRRGLLAVSAVKRLAVFEELCANFSVGIMDAEVMKTAGDIHAELRKAGIVIEDADVLTAAFCIRNEYILVTHNVKHFKDIKDLNVIDWVE